MASSTFRLRPFVPAVLIIGVALAVPAVQAAVGTEGLVIAAALLSILALAALDAFVRQLTIDETGVELRWLFGRRRINFGDIKYSSLERESGVRTLPIITLRLVVPWSMGTRAIVVRTFWWRNRAEMIRILTKRLNLA